ncbi:MAG: hypothetical protein KDD42_01570 [Bdellovibrionales bacterium]|nr:hypothetical protein [Bdellovibrionales bacterium]
MIRKVLLFAVFAAFLHFLYLYSSTLQNAVAGVSRRLSGVLNQRELRFAGLNFLHEKDLNLQRYSAKSNFWWLFNKEQLATDLRQHPLISEVQVSTCGSFGWGCFLISVTERKPAMFVMIGEELWMVGDDNGLIMPVTRGDSNGLMGRLMVKYRIDGPIVEGILPSSGAPDVLAPRLKYVRGLIDTIETSTGLKIDRVHLDSNGETAVFFRGLELEATFGLAKQDPNALATQARRLKAILDEFRGRHQLLKSVDLAFGTQAVVKLVQ